MTNNNWKDLHPNFTLSLQYHWEIDNNFTYQQTQEWINIGLTPQDADFCAWLQAEGYTALAVLNYADKQALQKAYQKSLTNPQLPFSFPQPPIAFILTLIATYLLTN